MTKDKSESVVLGDIGGTNTHFAVLQDGVLSDVEHMKVSEYRQFADALDTFIKGQSAGRSIHHAIFGVAGVVEREHCALTNNPWIVAADELRAGLGVAAYIHGERGDFVLRSEGGHATLPSGSSREDAIIANLRTQFGHVSAERVLSGPGLENLYCVIASLDSQIVAQCTAAQITEAALANRCAVSRTALDTFCGLLGGVAGNLALSFGAQGGVYIAGGIAPQLRDYLPQSQFRSRFEAKGRLTSYRKPIPTYLVLHDDPAFVGLQFLASHESRALRSASYHG
jgi:glucokinase